jgi:hypothetical protein
MRDVKYLLAVFLLAVTFEGVAQRTINSKSNVTRLRVNRNAAKVSGVKAKIICPVFENSRYPYQGLGIKLGDPFSVTYKFYVSKKFAVGVDFGKPASSLYNRYFRGKFTQYAEADTIASSETGVRYLTHKVKRDLVGEFKVTYHIDAKKVSPGLVMYFGAGWQWKNTKLQYDYLYNDATSENQVGHLYRKRLTMGPQVFVGIEYAYFQIPVSAFIEGEFYADMQADLGWHRFEGGLGLRYIF